MNEHIVGRYEAFQAMLRQGLVGLEAGLPEGHAFGDNLHLEMIVVMAAIETNEEGTAVFMPGHRPSGMAIVGANNTPFATWLLAQAISSMVGAAMGDPQAHVHHRDTSEDVPA